MTEAYHRSRHRVKLSLASIVGARIIIMRWRLLRAIRSKGAYPAAVIFQLQFAQDLLKSRRSDIAAVLIPM
jgi:hypothetical protein